MAGESCPSRQELSAFVLGHLPEPALERIAQHLDACGDCEAVVAALDQLSDPVVEGLRRPVALGSGSSTSLRPLPGVAPARPMPDRIGDYHLLRELGRGGMGIVYEAEQISLGRRVALKVLPHHALLDQQSVERFRREARASARLHHTNIVPIFGTGEQDGLHYFVMQLIPGAGLDRILIELRRRRDWPDEGRGVRGEGREEPSNFSLAPHPSSLAPHPDLAASVQGLLTGRFDPAPGSDGSEPSSTGSPSGSTPAPDESVVAAVPAQETGVASSGGSLRTYWMTVARLGIQVAEALAFAHVQGVVHRDVKPSNLLLDPHGRLWITDFGLAKEAAAPEDLTRSGFLVGTLRYLPPERFQGSCDARGDVYGLGLTLYELLTLRPAFPETDRSKLLHQVMHDEPPPPRRLQPSVPRDLETIVLKAIARDPSHRYTTAADLADDLRRFVEDRPIRARRARPLERLWRACRRDPVRAGLMAALILVFLIGVAGVVTQWLRAERRAHDQQEARQEADRSRDAARRSLYFSQIAQAQLEWRLNDVAAAEGLLERCEPDQRGWEWHFLHNVNHAELQSLPCRVCNGALSLRFSPDGRQLACAGWAPFRPAEQERTERFAVWDFASGRRLPPEDHSGSPRHYAALQLSYSPDGKVLAVGYGDTAELWRDGQRVRTWKANGTITFSPDGRLLATGSDREIVLCNAAAGGSVRGVSPLTLPLREVGRFPSEGGRVTFRPDGKVLAVSSAKAVVLLDAQDGHEVGRLPHGAREAQARGRRNFPQEGPELAFSPDGRFLATAAEPPELWDTSTGRLLHTFTGHVGPVAGVAYGPDGRYVATAGHDGSVRLWDAQTGAELQVWRGHVGGAARVAFHPDGWCLASGGSQDGTIKVWDLTRTPDHLVLPPASAQAFHFDGTQARLSLVGIEGDLQVRDLNGGATLSRRQLDLTQEWLTPAGIVAFSDDGQRVVTIPWDRNQVKIWGAATGTCQQVLSGLEVPAISVAINQDGSRVAAVGRAKVNTKGGQGGGNLPRPPMHEVRVWDANAGRTLSVFHPASSPSLRFHGSVALSPDGSRVAYDDFVGASAWVRVADANSGQALRSLTLDGTVRWLTFSADGRLLAAVSESAVSELGTIRVWEVETGHPVLAQPVQGPGMRLAFSPDGQRLAAADRDGVKVWELAEGRALLSLRGALPRASDGGFNPALAWGRDGRLAVANWDGTISVWEGVEKSPAPSLTGSEIRRRVYHWHLHEVEKAAAAGQVSAALFHLEHVNRQEPPNDLARQWRGKLRAWVGDLQGAAADLDRVFAATEPDDARRWTMQAALLLHRGDHAGYQRLCARMQVRWPHDHDLQWSLFLLRTVALASQPPDLELVDRIVKESPVHPINGTEVRLALSLAELRAGHWRQVVSRLEELATRNDRPLLERPILALAHHHLGHAREARAWMMKAQAQHEGIAQALKQPGGGLVLPVEWLEFEVLYAEAAAQIGTKR